MRRLNPRPPSGTAGATLTLPAPRKEGGVPLLLAQTVGYPTGGGP